MRDPSELEKLGKNSLLYAALAGASVLIVFSRRPDAILNPQFWAEDGRVWYADAYNHGMIYSLLTPEAAYFQTFSRVIAIIGQSLPLDFAPLFFNLAAIGVQAVVAAFIVSPRLSRAVPNTAVRLLIAFIYLALPHSSEVFANVTNSQWHLALLSFLIVVSTPSDKVAWRVFDLGAVLISALSGPLCLLLVPIAAIRFWQSREKWILVLLSVLAGGAVVQTVSLFTHQRPSQAELGAGLAAFFRITARHLFISPLIGGRGFSGLAKQSGFSAAAIVLANVLGFGLLVYSFLTSKFELKLLILFSALVCVAAIASPAVSPDLPQWEAMASDNTALRYWFIPNLCLFVSLVSLAASPRAKWLRYAALATLLASLSGIAADWRQPRFKDLDFPGFAAEFKNVPAGGEFTIPINPNWEMKLVRK